MLLSPMVAIRSNIILMNISVDLFLNRSKMAG